MHPMVAEISHHKLVESEFPCGPFYYQDRSNFCRSQIRVMLEIALILFIDCRSDTFEKTYKWIM